MNFNTEQKTIFYKNLNALNNTLVKEHLTKIKTSKFELIIGKDSLNINLKDTSDNTFLYSNPIDELNSMLNIYNDKYLLYPVLYFYGFGNGILFKALLQNKNHKHIVVFEKDLEIIWMMFHVIDFSIELKQNKLLVSVPSLLLNNDLSFLFSQNLFFNFSRVFFLELTSNYYEKYHQEIIKFNQKILDVISQVVLLYGNDPIDALKGVENFIFNIPKILTHPTLLSLSQIRKKLSKTAIIVSTGPSLIQQLPLLKQYANKATIIAADSSYPILAKYNIKPDYVVSLERVIETSKFFDNNFKEFDQDIFFIIFCLTHPKTIELLEKNNRKYILAHRQEFLPMSLGLEKFQGLSIGQSVAHLAYGLAVLLEHKNIILIGQDLAYAPDGSSHPEEHDYGKFDDIPKEMIKYDLQTPAYGGNGLVYTTQTWNLFRVTLSNQINYAKKELKIITYNCTEGGARIEGSIEKPFLTTCKELLKKDINKPFVKIPSPNKAKQDELLLKVYFKICKKLKDYREIKNNFIKKINEVENEFKNCDNDINKNIVTLNACIKKIDKIKVGFDIQKSEIKQFTDASIPLISQFELNLAKIYILNPKTLEDSFYKLFLWVQEHLGFFQIFLKTMELQEEIILKNLYPLENEIKQRKLDKYIQRIKNAYQ
ncbi:TPA: motility associated factor glycosyltransferase family protein [Campylobacter jejuni]|nr:motility associated factor glycosyltransferase family protein [Campylobacter jejuni]